MPLGIYTLDLTDLPNCCYYHHVNTSDDVCARRHAEGTLLFLLMAIYPKNFSWSVLFVKKRKRRRYNKASIFFKVNSLMTT